MADAEPRPEIDGRLAALAALRGLLLELPAAATRQIWLVDADSSDWPLDDLEVLAALTRWARLPGRRLIWIGEAFEALARSHPRLALWRRDFAHAVQPWRPTPEGQITLPCWLMTEQRAVVLDDRQHWRGHTVTAASELRDLRDASDVLLQHCEPGWQAYTLGL